MKRRSFFAVLGGAIAWPLAAHADQLSIRRVGVLMSSSQGDPVAQDRFQYFVRNLRSLGWTDGTNIYVEVRWPGADMEAIKKFAGELASLRCDIIVTTSTPTTALAMQELPNTPIVFTNVSDPVGEGFVSSLSAPGGNITGFINYEGSFAGKWVQLLKEVDPRVTRAAILFNPEAAPRGGSYFGTLFETAANSLSVAPVAIPIRSDADIEAAISSIGREPGGGVVMAADSFMGIHIGKFVESAARQRVPAVYPFRRATTEGGLLSYGPDLAEFYRPLGPYVDRILRGAKPSDLPVQVPTGAELIINLRGAKALGLEVPASL